MKLYTVRRVGWSDYSDFTKRTRRDGQQQLLVISLNDESLQNCDVQFSWEKGLISIITIPSMHLNSDPHNEKISQSWPLHWKRKGASRKWVYYLLNYTKYSLKASFLNGAFFWHIYNRVEFFIIRLYYLFFNCIILLSTRYVVQVKNI